LHLFYEKMKKKFNAEIYSFLKTRGVFKKWKV